MSDSFQTYNYSTSESNGICNRAIRSLVCSFGFFMICLSRLSRCVGFLEVILLRLLSYEHLIRFIRYDVCVLHPNIPGHAELRFFPRPTLMISGIEQLLKSKDMIGRHTVFSFIVR